VDAQGVEAGVVAKLHGRASVLCYDPGAQLERPRSSVLPPAARPSLLLSLLDWLVQSLPGRLLLAGGVVKLLTLTLTPLLGAPAGAWRVVDTAAGVAIVAGAAALAWRVMAALRRRLLWRVRRKLTLSYIFIGVVPAALIIAFFLLAGLLLFFNLSAYLTQSRMGALVDQAAQLAQVAAEELRAAPDVEAATVLARRQVSAAVRYPYASFAFLPGTPRCASAPAGVGAAAGPWAHLDPPAALPDWVPCMGWSGLAAYTEGAGGDTRLAVRAVTVLDRPEGGAVVVEFPVGAALTRQFRTDAGIVLGSATALEGLGAAPAPGRAVDAPAAPGLAEVTTLAGRLGQPLPWVAFLDFTDWATGGTGRVAMSIGMSVPEVYARISSTPVPFSDGSLTSTPGAPGDFDFSQVLLVLLTVVGGTFLVIQGVAFVMGFALARSITGSVHELFAGTERVRRGDFAHKIAIRTRDQLGELAESFNSMTASIEDLLEQKAEKERLEEELRIARTIQMSLLPQTPPALPGLTLTAHCEPAREVGGDYYDLFRLDEHRLGVLVADVSGKGTSAALYMAELKGVMLSLSLQHDSPRELLVAADRILADHLDTRSFITVTYAVVDMQARTLTYARAGHCPLIYHPGPHASPRRAQVLAPDGLVLGLQLDGGVTFARLLEEQTMALGDGDVIVLYTDGLSEAMNASDECFGEDRLTALVEAHADLDAEGLRQRILDAVARFTEGMPPHDDMTLLLLKVAGEAAA
jgi:serine phosphatase RsbU (regulator of sigma subunit)